MLVERTNVTDGFFDATGMQFIAGRPLVAADGQRGVVINETLARQGFSNSSPIGEHLQLGGRPTSVVGVVRDAHDRGLAVDPRPWIFAAVATPNPVALVTYSVRSSETLSGAPAEWDRAIERAAPGAVVLDDSSLQERLNRSIRDRSFAALVMVLFAGATTSVMAAGLWGVVAYVVTRRTREIGIRLAIGGRAGQIVWLVMRDALAAAACGASCGLVLSLWLSRTLEGLLYGVSAGDLATLLLMTTGLLALALVAGAIPALRAGRLSPSVALRTE
jgi:ABC-type antimicrobial peptide transport system permease subunit